MKISLPASREFVSAIAAVCLLSASVQASAEDLPRLVAGVAQDQDLMRTFEDADAWKQARSHVNAMLFADHTLARHGDQDLELVLGRMRLWNLKLELEVGAIKPWAPTGDEAFRRQKPNWDRIARFGGGISSFAMDEPLTAARRRLVGQNDEYALAETARFVADVRRAYPGAMIGDIEPYPGIDLASHEHWLYALEARLRGVGIRGLDFYRVDVDWVAFTVAERGNWVDVETLEEYCHSLHIPFSLIYWASDYPSKRKLLQATDATWYNGIMREGQAYQAIGATPDQFVIESWVGAPSRDIPESAAFTFMRSVRDFSLRYAPPK